MLSAFPPIYQNKLPNQGVQDVVSINKIKIEPHGDLVDETFSQFNKNLIKNQDPQSEIENDEHQGQNISMTMIQKTHRQTKLLQFPTLCYKYYKMMKS